MGTTRALRSTRLEMLAPVVGTPVTHSLFGTFDRDGSGGIDRTELRSALHNLGLPTDARQLDAVLAKYDVEYPRRGSNPGPAASVLSAIPVIELSRGKSQRRSRE